MKFKKMFSQLLAIILLMALCVMFAATAQAQPYYTNSVNPNGAYLPNASVLPATQPSATLAAQYALGINTGTWVNSSDGTFTNTFSTNYVYSTAPVVTVSPIASAGVTNNLGAVVSVTTTNFIWKGVSGITNNYTAIGK